MSGFGMPQEIEGYVNWGDINWHLDGGLFVKREGDAFTLIELHESRGLSEGLFATVYQLFEDDMNRDGEVQATCNDGRRFRSDEERAVCYYLYGLADSCEYFELDGLDESRFWEFEGYVPFVKRIIRESRKLLA